MAIQFNVRLLAKKPVLLVGEATPEELELVGLDELVRPVSNVDYDLQVSLHEGEILVEGRVGLSLKCECSRCLKSFESGIELDPWQQLLPLEGEDKVLIVNDFVDLTPLIREDIVLAFPQHPLCGIGCSGLQSAPPSNSQSINGAREHSASVSAWAELDKLKF